MALSAPTLSHREDTSEGHPALHKNALTTKSQWEQVLDDPSLRRLLREGHHVGGGYANVPAQLEEER